MLACTETVTVVKCDGEIYTATVYVGVSWFEKVQIKLEGKGMVYANAVKVRIPADALPPSGLLPEEGDHIIRGQLPLGTVIQKPADLAAFHPCKVMGVSDNRRGGIPHVAVMAQ